MSRLLISWIVGGIPGGRVGSLVLWFVGLAALAAPAATAAVPGAAATGPWPALEVRAVELHLDPPGSVRRPRLHARAIYRLARPAREGDQIRLLDFAGHLETESLELDEVALGRRLDGPFEATRTTLGPTRGVLRVRREGVLVSLRPQPGVTEVELELELAMPRRYWPLGCSRGMCAATAAPGLLPATAIRDGGYVPQRVSWEVVIAPGWEAAVRVLGTGAPYPVVVWAEALHTRTSLYRGVELRMHAANPIQPSRVPVPGGWAARHDVAGHAEFIAQGAIDALTELGRPPSVGTTLDLVIGPLRSTVAQAHPGAVLISDEAYALFPARKFQDLHAATLARAMADALVLADPVQPAGVEEQVWGVGAWGHAAAEIWRDQGRTPDLFAQDLLRGLSFFPTVDRFLYGGQAAFADSYFRAAEDTMPLRDHPLFFANSLPTGRRIHEKLVDLIGRDAVRRTYENAGPGGSLAPSAEQAYARRLGWFFEQWLGPLPVANVRIADVSSRRAVGGGWAHRITVERDGDYALEPVQLLVEARGDPPQALVWNGEVRAGDPVRHVFETTTRGRLQRVRLDPRGRITQSSLDGTTDPKFDDRRPAGLRFLYNGIGINLSLSELVSRPGASRFDTISGFAFFEASLRRDLRRTLHLQVFRDREAEVGGEVAWAWRFGKLVNRRRRRARVELGVAPELLSPRGLDAERGFRLGQSLTFVDDTRRFLWWPELGHRFDASAVVRETWVGEGPPDVNLTVGAGYTQMFRLAHQHVIASRVGLSYVQGLRGSLKFRDFLRGGGIAGLSGYDADALFGRAAASVRLDYRHPLLRNLRVNAVELAWLRQVDGAVFAGATALSPCDGVQGWFAREQWVGNVGYGLSARMQILGVVPQLLRLDVSVPTVRRFDKICGGRAVVQSVAQQRGVAPEAVLRPVTVNLMFHQPF